MDLKYGRFLCFAVQIGKTQLYPSTAAMAVGAQFAELSVFRGSTIERVALQLTVVKQFSNWGYLVDAYVELLIYLISDVQVRTANNDERSPSLSEKLFDHDSTCSGWGGNADTAASWT